MQLDIMTIISGSSLVINLVIIIIQSKMRAEILELKAHVYERFITKSEMRYYITRTHDE